MTEKTQPTNAELLPCPFCGTQPDVKLYTAQAAGSVPAVLGDDELVRLGKSPESGLPPWGIGTTRADYLRAVRAVLAAARAPAESVLEDAARWNEVLMHVGAADHLGGQHFTLNTLRIRDQLFLLRGSVAQHFTACIDDSRAARKQGANHD